MSAMLMGTITQAARTGPRRPPPPIFGVGHGPWWLWYGIGPLGRATGTGGGIVREFSHGGAHSTASPSALLACVGVLGLLRMRI